MLNQVPILDSLRAAAAWSVCLFHFVCTTTGLFDNVAVYNSFYYGQFGTHVFFVISGFVIPWSMYHAHYRLSAFPKFVLKRFTRIEPPYIASVALVLIVAYVKGWSGYGSTDVYGGGITLKRVLLHLGYLINFMPEYKWLNGVYWTLAIEFQYYLIMALLFVLLVHAQRTGRYLAYALCFAMSVAVPDQGHAHFPFYAPLFLFGVLVFLRMAGFIGPPEFWIMTAACIVFNALFCESVSAIIGPATALVILYFHQVKIPVLNALGKISYSTYLVHPVLGAAAINILSHRYTLEWQKWIIVLVGIAVTVVSSYIMYYLIERPSKKLASSIKLG